MKSKSTRKPAVKAVKAAKVPRKNDPTLQLLKLVVQALDAKKAEDLQVLDVSEQSSITDYLVLANANSDPHLRALRVELEKVLDSNHARILGMDASKGSGWTVVDAFELMVHLFTTENREKYRMDLLWKDASEVPLSKLLK
jgi:ribosome-associated protein